MPRVVDVCAFSAHGRSKGDTLRWAANRGGLYILHAVIDSTGRRLKWKDTKRNINQISIRDRGDALKMLRPGRYATRLRHSAGGAPNLLSPEKLLLELDDGTIVPLLDSHTVTQ